MAQQQQLQQPGAIPLDDWVRQKVGSDDLLHQADTNTLLKVYNDLRNLDSPSSGQEAQIQRVWAEMAGRARRHPDGDFYVPPPPNIGGRGPIQLDSQVTPTASASSATPKGAMAGPDTNDLQPDFKQRLMQMIAASHGMITINSGFRDDALQAKLYAQAVQKYGAAGAGKWVAPPGHSNHNKGLAADLGGDMALAHQLAPQFGLYFPMSWENWHIEPVSTAADRGQDPQAYTTSPFGDVNPTQQDRSNDPAYQAANFMNAITSTADGSGSGIDLTSDQSTGAGGDLPTVDFSKPPTTTGADPSATTGPNSFEGSSFTSGSGGGGGSNPTGGVNLVTWAHDFLTAGGFPTTSANMQAIQAWARAEGGAANNNPLNTTQGGYAGHKINSVGVMNYDSYDDSIRANLQALNNGRYGNVISALKQGSDAKTVASAVGSSPWGTSGALMSKILAEG